MLLAWVLIALRVLAVSAAVDHPGPQTTEQRDGREAFITNFSDKEKVEMTFYVKDYGVLKPKVVYNCAIATALCANAIQYLGAGVSSKSFHFDMDSRRSKTRRKGVCNGNAWLGTKDNPRCPQANQPRWDFDYNHGEKWAKSQEVVMWIDDDDRPSLKQLAYKKPEPVVQDDGTIQIQDVLYPYGALLTCDEFPAATDGRPGAPQGGYGCGGAIYEHNMESDQNWQAKAFDQIQTWLVKMSAGRNTAGQRDMGRFGGPKVKDLTPFGQWYQQRYFIYNIEFEMKTISDPKDEAYGTAVWVEANGHKRYCYGPNVKGGCSPDRRDNDPEPLNEDMPGEPAWEGRVWPNSP